MTSQRPVKWRPLGTAAPASLADARAQLHWAAQPVVALAEALVAPEPDDAHATMVWDPVLRALMARPTEGSSRFRIGLRIADGKLLAVDAEGKVFDEHTLGGASLSDAYEWVHRVAGERLGAVPSTLARGTSRSLEDHAVGWGAPFDLLAHRGALAELCRWFGNAHLALNVPATTSGGAGPVRSRTRRFDTSVLVRVRKPRVSDPLPTVRLGMSPGDRLVPEPHWFVRPSPRPQAWRLPGLAGGGAWLDAAEPQSGDTATGDDSEDTGRRWPGAVLTAEEVVAAGDGPAQEAAVATFLGATRRACLDMFVTGT